MLMISAGSSYRREIPASPRPTRLRSPSDSVQAARAMNVRAASAARMVRFIRVLLRVGVLRRGFVLDGANVAALRAFPARLDIERDARALQERCLAVAVAEGAL